MKTKMNTMLATLEHSAATTTRMLRDYAQYFKTKGGAFKGIVKTYTAREGYLADPSKMGTTQVVTTVDEKLDWLQNELSKHMKNLFAVEKTNSLGAKTVELVVEGHSFGHLTALELMRLKSFLTRAEFEDIYTTIPVRSDSQVWNPTTKEEYANRSVFETPMISGVSKTTENEEVILKDPNLNPDKLPSNYTAKTTIKRKTVEVGDYTSQEFSGEWNHAKRAELLRRRSALLAAVIAALKEVNDTEVVDSELNVGAMLSYIHYGE